MLLIDGKKHYTLEEAATQSGYTVGTISNYIYSGIAEGHKTDDGTWFVTQAGLVTLFRRRKKELDETPDEKAPVPLPEPVRPSVPLPVPTTSPKTRLHGPNGKSVHFTTPEALTILSRIEVLAGVLDLPVKEVVCDILETYLKTSAIMEDILEIETRRKLIAGKVKPA